MSVNRAVGLPFEEGQWEGHLLELRLGEAQVQEKLDAGAQVVHPVLHNAREAQQQHAQLPVLQAHLLRIKALSS